MSAIKRLPAIFYTLPSRREPVRDWLLELDKSDRMKHNPHLGSSFDSFLEQEGTLHQTTARALKRLIARQLDMLMQEQGLSKTALAGKMQTSRSQLDRLLDPENDSVTLDTLVRAAHAVGRQVSLELV